MKRNDPIECNSCWKRWLRLFNKWFFAGLVLILLSVIIDIATPNDILKIFAVSLTILSDILKTVGIALLIGAIFDYAKNSQDFMDFISKILSEIVISKSFLNKLSESDKNQALEILLQPSGELIQNHSNINDYFHKKIKDSLNMFNTNFKTNLVLTLNAHKKDGVVEVSGTMTNRIYKINDTYQPIITTFERDKSQIISAKIIHPLGVLPIKKDDYKFEQGFEAGVEYSYYSFTIPKELYKHPYLTIQKEISELGYDHWTNFNWTSLTPCDGINFSLSCSDDLVIKEYVVFDKKDSYDVTVTEDKVAMSIISTSWLDAFTGFTITIANKTDIGKETAF